MTSDQENGNSQKRWTDENRNGFYDRLSTRPGQFFLPTNHDQAEHAHGKHGSDSWQVATLHFLHSRPVQLTLAALLLLDIVILFIESFLVAEYPPCTTIQRDAISCCPKDAAADSLHRDLAESICEAPLHETTYEAGCDPHKWNSVHQAEHVLFALTMTILGTFFVELCIQIVVLTPCIFFRHIMYALDFFIVTVSIILEAIFTALQDEQLAALFGLIVLGRIWRFLRISHGIAELAAEFSTDRYKELLAYTEELEEKMKEAGMTVRNTPSIRKLHKVSSKDMAVTQYEERLKKRSSSKSESDEEKAGSEEDNGANVEGSG